MRNAAARDTAATPVPGTSLPTQQQPVNGAIPEEHQRTSPTPIESAGKQLTAARIKGPGMRWNVADLHALLALRCVLLEHSGQAYWESHTQLAA